MRTIVVLIALSSSGCSCQQTGSCDSDESSESSESSYSGGCGGPFDEPPVPDLSVRLDQSWPRFDLTPPDDAALDGSLDDAAAPTD